MATGRLCNITIEARFIILNKRENNARYGFTVQNLPLPRFLSPHCVSVVVPNSLAHQAGMKVDDFILEINGADATTHSHDCLTSFLDMQRDLVTLLVVNCSKSNSGWSQLRTAVTRNDPAIVIPTESDLVLQAYKEIYNTHFYTDFVMVSCDEKEYSVHRAILAARCPVFAAMLSHDTQERKTGRCIISDLDGETLNAMLEYLYSNSVERVLLIVEKCLVAADKYCIDGLRFACEKHLLTTITTTNSADLLLLAHQYYLVELEEKVTNFVRENLIFFLRRNQGNIAAPM